MRTLDILPQRADDALRAETRVKVYHRKLGAYSYAALGRMASKAIDTCKWFPSVAECLEILRKHPTEDECRLIRSKARALSDREHQARHDEAMGALKLGQMDQAQIDALSDRLKQCAETLGYLFRWPDQTYTARLPIGPDAGEEELAARREETRRWQDAWDAHRRTL